MKKIAILFFALAMCGNYYGQKKEDTTPKRNVKLTQKGAMFAFWGWNRAAYTVSNIHFTGANYDFTLHSVVAHDRQSPVSFYNYLAPGRVTIPQTNLRIGYFIKDNLSIVFGVDHMKYVMDQSQVGRFSGHITDPHYASMVDGNGHVDLTNQDFLKFEHTDGLNYINFGIEKYINIYNNRWFDINWSYGGGLGFMLPRSNVTLFANKRSDRFHLAGFGLDGRTNLNLVFWKHVMLRAEFKIGYINMPSIMTTLHNKPDKASQYFGFTEFNFGLGYMFQTVKKAKQKTNEN